MISIKVKEITATRESGEVMSLHMAPTGESSSRTRVAVAVGELLAEGVNVGAEVKVGAGAEEETDALLGAVAAGGVNFVPQFPQNATPSGFCVPH